MRTPFATLPLAGRPWKRSRAPRPLYAALLLPLLLAAAAPPAGASGLHPSMLFAANDVPALRAKIHDGGDDDRAWAEIQARWLEYQSTPLDSLADVLGGSTVAAELGLLSQLEDRDGIVRPFLRQFLLHIAAARDVDLDDYTSSLRLRALALGYDLAFDAAIPGDLAPVRAEILSYLAFMPGEFNYSRYAYNPYVSNRGMMVGSSMGLAAIAVWDEVAPHERPVLVAALDFASTLVDKCLRDLLASDGSYREGVLYGAWTMRMLIPYLEARRRFDGVDLGTDPRLTRIAEWLAYEVLPEGDGRTNNLNDSPWFSRPLVANSTVLDWAQTRYGSTLARWLYRHLIGAVDGPLPEHTDRVATVLWSQSLPETDPATILPRSRLFEDRGLYIHRSGWTMGGGGDEVLFTLYAGRFYGGHAQEDQGQFTLRAYGDRYALDNGSAFPTPTPKETQSHNLVLIDGVGQHNAGWSIGTDAHFAGALSSPSLDALHVDLGSAYATHSPYNDPNQPFPGTDWSWGYDGGNPVERAARRVLVVKDPAAPTWFLVADDFRKDGGTHRWEWLLHTDATNSVQIGQGLVSIQGSKSRLYAYFAHPLPPALELSVAPYANGGEDPSTARIVAAVDAIEPRFVVALVPLPGGAPAPQVTTSNRAGMTRLQLDWGTARDYAVVAGSGGSAGFPIRTDGELAFVRVAASQVTRWTLFEGRELAFQSSALVELSEPASATLAGATLHLDRSDVQFRAWGPQITQVLGPLGPLPFARDGAWVENVRTTSTGPPALGPTTVIAGGDAGVRIDCVSDPGRAARVAIHDVRGRLVRALWTPPGDGTSHGVEWDCRDGNGRWWGAGIYFVRAPECAHHRLGRIVVVH